MVEIDVGDIDKGEVLKIDGNLFKVLKKGQSHTARGGATYKFKVKNITEGGTKKISYNAGKSLERVQIETLKATYLYNSGEMYTFMEVDTSEMNQVHEDQLQDQIDYLKENLDVYLVKYENRVIDVILPDTITYKIKETVPGVQGNRKNAGTKPATLETGLEVKVKSHKSEGDEVTLNTNTGEVS